MTKTDGKTASAPDSGRQGRGTDCLRPCGNFYIFAGGKPV